MLDANAIHLVKPARGVRRGPVRRIRRHLVDDAAASCDVRPLPGAERGDGVVSVLLFPARFVPVEHKPMPLQARLEVWLRVRLWRIRRWAR